MYSGDVQEVQAPQVGQLHQGHQVLPAKEAKIFISGIRDARYQHIEREFVGSGESYQSAERAVSQ